MNKDKIKSVINDGSVNTLLDDELNESRVNNILEAYMEIIDDINKEYNEKTKKLVKRKNEKVEMHFNKK